MEPTNEDLRVQLGQDAPAIVPAHEVNRAVAGIAPQPSGTSCPSCAGGSRSQLRSYVYALGKIETRFPSAGVEKEFAQAIGRSETAGLTDSQALHAVLSKREYRYLTRQLCWLLTIQGLETYLVMPRDPIDLELLVEAAFGHYPNPRLSLVIGLRGPVAPPDMCNGLTLPVVAFDQIYSFDQESLISALPKPEGAKSKEFIASATELFERIIQMTDNAGATDENRALNYLAVRYPVIYSHVCESHVRNLSLTAIVVRPSALSSTRKIVEVIFSFTNRNTDFTEKAFVRVDVTEEFPYLVTKLSPYYDR